MNVKEDLIGVFRRVFDDDQLQIADSTTANDVDGWDSLSHVHLVVAVEKKFNVRFRTSEVTSLKNVGDFIALIDRKVGELGSNNRV